MCSTNRTEFINFLRLPLPTLLSPAEMGLWESFYYVTYFNMLAESRMATLHHCPKMAKKRVFVFNDELRKECTSLHAADSDSRSLRQTYGMSVSASNSCLEIRKLQSSAKYAYTRGGGLAAGPSNWFCLCLRADFTAPLFEIKRIITLFLRFTTCP